jgi:hypothetical protein
MTFENVVFHVLEIETRDLSGEESFYCLDSLDQSEKFSKRHQ